MAEGDEGPPAAPSGCAPPGAGLVGRVRAGRKDVARKDGAPKRASGWKQQRERVGYSDALAKRLCARVAAGELLYAVCRERGMPTAQAVGRWAKARPEFGAALAEARRAGGRGPGASGRYGGGVFSICDEVVDEVFERLCEGESLTAIGDDPSMPSLSTLFYWRRAFPAFEEVVTLGARIRAERLADEGWDMAMEATPATAYLTGVRLGHLRWMTGVMAPRNFRVKMVEPEAGPKVVKTLFRHFEVEVDPETGARKVVAWCPNPETGQVEREDTPGWRPPAGYGRLPGG